MSSFWAILIAVPMIAMTGCNTSPTKTGMADPSQNIAELRAAYAAFIRGDIDAAAKAFDPAIEWTEPAEFPGGGTYHGIDAAKRYLTQSRAGAAEVISEPERFIVSGDRIVVFVHSASSRQKQRCLARSSTG